MNQSVKTVEPFETSRCEPRQGVEWAAVCNLGAGVLNGVVRDISNGGFFFAAECGWLDGVLQPDPVVEELVAREEQVSIELSDGKSIMCEVRWAGESVRHGCRGIGLERITYPRLVS